MGLLAVLQTKMGKPLTIHDIFIWLALQNSSIDAHNLHTPHLGLCKSKGTAKRKVLHQDCLSDSGKILQGDTLSSLLQEFGQLVLVTITNSAT